MMSMARWVLSGLAAGILVAVLVSDTYRPIFLSGSGVAEGALVAAIALGVVLTYRGSGVVNLANGAIAMYAAYTYTILRSEGDLFLPPLPNPLRQAPRAARPAAPTPPPVNNDNPPP